MSSATYVDIDIEIVYSYRYTVHMDYELKKRAELFGQYVCSEIKGAVVAHGHTQEEVAKATKRQKANISRWLNGKPVIPVEVAYEICDYIGVRLQTLVARAEQRVTDDLGPYPPLEVDPSQLPEDEKIQYVLDKIKAGDQTLVASTDPYKEEEKEGGDGR